MEKFINKKLNKLEKKLKIIRIENNNADILLEINKLKTYFPILGGIFRRPVGWVKAVDDVSFQIKNREIFGLVGESGCGKSTIGRTIIRLYKPTAGDIFYHDKAKIQKGYIQDIKVDLAKLSRREYLTYRKNIQMIFQDPYSSLNPRFTVNDIVSEPLSVHKTIIKSKRKEYVASLLNKVGLSEDHLFRYPHEFSGGQRQRIGIARALSTNPKLIIADEPVSALDVSIQAQVINLIQDLQQEFEMSYIFIAHDLAVVKHISHRIAVMYLGNIMEIGPANEIYNNPTHPYTQALISAIPKTDPNKKTKRQILTGDVPSASNKPSGCPFNTRCPIGKNKSICKEERPELKAIRKQQFSACHFAEK